MILRELFDRPYTQEIVIDSPQKLKIRYRFGDKQIAFTAVNYSDGYWEISFSEEKELAPNRHLRRNIATGTGHEVKVFSAVAQSVKYLIDQYQPDTIEFTSSEDTASRLRLYDRLAMRIEKLGYKQDPSVIKGVYRFKRIT